MNYFESWHANLSDYLKGYLYNEEGDAKPVRFVFDKLKSYLLDFAVGKFGEKIKNKIYIHVDYLTYNNFSMKYFVKYKKKKINSSLFLLKDKTLIFIDE